MKNVLILVTGFAVAAATAGDIRISFGEPSVDADPTPDLPGAYPIVVDTADAAFSVTWGVWAEIGIDATNGSVDQWNAVGVDVVEGGATVTTDMSNTDYNPSPFGTQFRWEDGSDFGGTSGNPETAGPNFTLINVTRTGLGNASLPPSLGGMDTDSYYNAGEDRLFYLLGTISIDVPQGYEGDIFFGTNTAGFDQSQVDGETVTFGSATPLTGGDLFGAIADTAMVSFIPEPASLVLIALAGLAIRRR